MEIEEFEKQQEELIAVEEKEKFVVDTLEKANWCMKKIRQHEQRKAELKAYRDREVKKIDDFVNGEILTDDSAITHFLELLRPYIEAQTEGTKSKSVKMPEGLVGLRSVPPSIDKDDEALKRFAGKDYIKTVETFDWVNYKRKLKIADGHMVTEDGEIVPGITVTEKPDAIYYKLESEEK